MQFNVISNLTNGVGLQRDYELLKHQLEIRGHKVRGVQFNQKQLIAPKADVNIFLEVVNPLAFKSAPQQWAVPNPEWWFAGWDQYPWDKVLAKTRDCERIFKAKFGKRCQFIGWMARDLYDAAITKQRKFLHVAGKSRFKNTPAVIAGCQHAGVAATIVGEYAPSPSRVTEKDLKILMNTHFCHVMPSMYEGYGQVLHEAMGVGQIVITTDAPPMNELTPVVLVPSAGTSPHHAGILHKVEGIDVARAIEKVLKFSTATLQQYGRDARANFHREQLEFELALDDLVGAP